MNPILALILANTIWGAGPPIFKLALTNVPPFTLAFIRFFLAAFLFLPVALRQPLRAMAWRDWVAIVGASFFGVTINIGFYFLGLERAPSINASVIASSAPVFVFLISVLFLRERARLRTSIGMMIAFLGILFLVFEPIIMDGQPSTYLAAWQGNIYYVIAMLGSVFFPLILKHVLERVNINVILCFGFFFSALTFLPFMLHELNTWQFSQLTGAGVAGIIYGVFFCSALAYWLYYYGLAQIATQEVGVFSYIDPIVTVVVAIPLLHEYPTAIYFAALFLVLLGIYISEGRIHYHPILKLRHYFNHPKIDPEAPLIKEP